jgi:hypothetical protein
MKKIVHDVQTGEISEIEMTEEEIRQFQLDAKISKENIKLQKAEAETKAAAKAALLAQLGITEEQAKLLLS